MNSTSVYQRFGMAAALLSLLALPVWAGNKVLMEKEGKELVSINEQVIKELPNVQNNSQVKLEANVVQRDGKTEIHIQSLSFTPEAGGGKVENKPASTAPAAKAPEPAVKNEKISSGGAAALSSDDMKAKIDELKAAHPKVHFVEVDKASVQSPLTKANEKPGKAFIAVWDE